MTKFLIFTAGCMFLIILTGILMLTAPWHSGIQQTWAWVTGGTGIGWYAVGIFGAVGGLWDD